MLSHSPHSLSKIFSSRNLTLILIIIFIFCLISLVNQTVKYFSIKKDINSLEAQIKFLEDQSQQLTASLDNVKSDFYKEREARLKFGLKLPGEKVAVIELGDSQNNASPASSSLDSFGPVQWWRYFFTSTPNLK
ncbi:MAG: septum formation initiator family protein [Candidatus Parcubacteria bacterium]|nr:septum formation initiator family protein [Candidatus Parcubacteria bacterium]